MNALLELTWRGALMLVVVASLDRLCATRISARVRKVWWLLVPVAFLVTVPLPVLPAAKFVAAGSARSPGAVTLSLKVAMHPAGRFITHASVWWSPTPWVLVIMVGGFVLYLFSVLARTAAALRRFRGLPLCIDPALHLILDGCKAEAGVTSRVGLVVSERVPAPLVLGWLRPRILLPSLLVTSLSREQLCGVLFHELAHVRASDVPCTILFTLVCALHWFNPAAHLALRGWAQCREEAADEAAIGWLGASSNLAYGETLLCVLRATSEPCQTFPAVLAVVGSVGQLRKRLLMIKQHSTKSSRHFLTATISLVAAGILLRPVHTKATRQEAAPVSPASAAQAGGPEAVRGSKPNGEDDATKLLRRIELALNAHDSKALQNCMSFERVDEQGKENLIACADALTKWPETYLSITKGDSDLPFEKLIAQKGFSGTFSGYVINVDNKPFGQTRRQVFCIGTVGDQWKIIYPARPE